MTAGQASKIDTTSDAAIAARAARFRNVKPPIGAFGDDGSRENSCNANGLQGRGNKNRPATKDGVMSKKYSKKNKRGSSLT